MTKKLWAFAIFCLIITSVSIACAVSPAIATTVGGGLTATWSWIVTQLGNVSTAVLASPIAPYMFWFGMPLIGIIIGATVVHRLHLGSRAKSLSPFHSSASPSGASLSNLQKEPAEPERQPITPTYTAKEQEPEKPKEELPSVEA